MHPPQRRQTENRSERKDLRGWRPACLEAIRGEGLEPPLPIVKVSCVTVTPSAINGSAVKISAADSSALEMGSQRLEL